MTPTDAIEKTALAAAGETFSRVPQRTVTGDAVDQIKRLIASGAISPGQKLPSERALADLLGVSRPTMREVMSALEAMGVVASRHGSGTYVTSLSAELLAGPLTFVLDVNREALDDLFEVRVLLEAGAAQGAAMSVDDERISALESYVAAMRAAVDADGLLEPDLAFHRLIHEASGNVVLLGLMSSLRVLTRQSLLASADSDSARRDAVAEHEAVLEGLRQRDPAAAGEAMRTHVKNARGRARAAEGEGADVKARRSPNGASWEEP